MEREITILKRQMRTIQANRDSLSDEVRNMRREFLTRRMVKGDSRRETNDVDDPDFFFLESGPSLEIHTTREIEDITLVHYSPLRGISKKITEDSA